MATCAYCGRVIHRQAFAEFDGKRLHKKRCWDIWRAKEHPEWGKRRMMRDSLVLKLVLLWFALFMGWARAQEVDELVVGQTYQGTPTACKELVDAQEIAQVHVTQGDEASEKLVLKKIAERKCIYGVRFNFTISRLIQAHKKEKREMNVAEIQTGELTHYLVNSYRIKAAKRSYNTSTREA